ncbi:alpha/beta fold hydrolase [Kitasatospora sp. GP82]|uniref:thioesterase II family protein n=1 Tax=Kitasatospora sp. GP82 TaxID=3035089 RepID=UPI002476BB53|nr:alpha/beta fold hydrolase [Kitasatospora sp. GP82]MDH6125448.1 surfactin synthase thioesterase subunit [Kitasatospora sp. GP82]
MTTILPGTTTTTPTPTTSRPGVRDLRRWAGVGGAASGPAEPELTVLLLHHAGGAAGAYTPFVRHLPPNWRVLGLELPGRLMSPAEAACHSAEHAVEWLLPSVAAELAGEGEYAVFGHSMGALVAFELVRELERQGRPPVWLGISGSPAPSHLGLRHGSRRDLWPHERLVQFMRELGGTPENVLDHTELVETMVRTLRGDLAIVDTYRYTEGPRLGVPVSVYTGREDPVAPEEAVRPWSEQTGAGIGFRSWPGGHFYLYEQVESVARQLRQDILAARRG